MRENKVIEEEKCLRSSFFIFSTSFSFFLCFFLSYEMLEGKILSYLEFSFKHNKVKNNNYNNNLLV